MAGKHVILAGALLVVTALSACGDNLEPGDDLIALAVFGAGTGAGVVTSNPAGVNCAIDGAQANGQCALGFPAGTVVVLTAVPNGDATFAGWGDDCEPASVTPTCQVTVSSPSSVTAAFAKNALQRIVVESFETPVLNQTELFLLEPNSGGRSRILPAGTLAASPTVSGDSRWLSYVGVGLGTDGQDLWIARTDGSDRRRLATSPGDEFAPTLSPDGSRLAYIKSVAGGPTHVWTIGADGAGERQLTSAPAGDPIAHSTPSWSPDGTKIAYAAGPPGNLQLWMMNADGTSPIQLTAPGAGSDVEPTWSPDSRKIAFVRTTSPAAGDLVIVDVDTKQLQPLGFARSNRYPAWSPDGSRIAFSSNLDGEEFEIYTVAPDGTQLSRITDNDVQDRRPAWLRR
jgi:Tol biopolymer transport system component